MPLKVFCGRQGSGDIAGGKEDRELSIRVVLLVMLSIASSRDNYLEAVDPLRARSRNTGNAVTTRGN
jgi:hypothetical protein